MKQIILLIFFYSVLSSAHAQTDRKPTYGIKLGITHILGKQLIVDYEQAISRQFSLYVNAGPTIPVSMSKYVSDFLTETHPFYQTTHIPVYDIYNVVPALGFVGGLGFKYYPMSSYSTAIKGIYVGAEFNMMQYNSKIKNTEDFKGSNVDPKDYRNQITRHSLRFHTGYQFATKKGLLLDLFVNMGVSANHEYLRNFSPTNSINNVIQYHTYEQRDRNVSIVSTFGIKMGFGGVQKNLIFKEK